MGCAWSKTHRAQKYECSEDANSNMVEKIQEEANSRRPKTKKAILVPNKDIFTDIDQHALSASPEDSSTVAGLAAHLTSVAKHDLDKVRSFWRFITHNIGYYTESYYGKRRNPGDAECVLRLRIGVSQGYSELFAELCRKADIPVKILSGYAKSHSYDPEHTRTLDDHTNHTWNIVQINNEWRFVDCTWGAGYLADGGKFRRSYKEFYFLTDPDKFIIEHFPYMNGDLQYSEPWQLLAKPWSIDQFSRRLKPHSKALDWGLEAVSHKDGVIHVNKEVVVILRDTAHSLAGIIAHLSQNGRHCDKGVAAYKSDKHIWKIHARPHETGTYKLEISGREKTQTSLGDKEDTSDQLIDYVLICDVIDPSAHPLPGNHGQMYGPIVDYAEYGFTIDIEKMPTCTSKNGELSVSLGTTRKLDVMVRLVHADEAIPNINNYAMTESTSKVVKIHLRLPIAGYYKMSIFGKQHLEESYARVHIVLVYCKTAADPCVPFS